MLRSGQARIAFNLGPGEKLKLSLVASLARDRKHALNLSAMGRLLERRIPEERPNGREAEVSLRRIAVSRGPPEMRRCRRVQIPQCQLRRRPAKACLRKCKQEPEGLPVGGDGVGAYASMSHEPIGEPPLDQHGQIVRGTHERTSHRLSSSRAAWSLAPARRIDTSRCREHWRGRERSRGPAVPARHLRPHDTSWSGPGRRNDERRL